MEDVNCTYEYILYHLNLTKNKELYTMVRPVKYHNTITQVYLQMSIYGILDVVSFKFTFSVIFFFLLMMMINVIWDW